MIVRFLTLFFCIGGCFWGAVAQGACTGYRTGSTCDRCLDGYKFDPANLSGDCIVAPASSKDDGAFGTGVSFVVIGAVAGIALLCGGCCYYFHHQRHLENQINPRQIQIAVAPSIPDKASRRPSRMKQGWSKDLRGSKSDFAAKAGGAEGNGQNNAQVRVDLLTDATNKAVAESRRASRMSPA